VAVVARADDEHSVLARRGGDPRRSIERHRQHESVVVIGVLADQVHASRRAVQPWRTAERRLELAREIAGDDHRGSALRIARISRIAATTISTLPQTRLTLMPSDRA